MKPLASLIIALCIALFAGCTTASRQTKTTGQHPVARNAFDAAKLAAIDDAIVTSISSNRLPGAVFWLEREHSIYNRAYGNRAVEPATEPMSADTIFDAASLTKVMATTPAILLLKQRGLLILTNRVAEYLPEFTGEGRENITLAHLLTHTSGLPAGIGNNPPWTGYSGGVQRALEQKPNTAPEAAFRYSDVNFILLGEVVRRVSGVTLDQFCRAEIYRPLGMRDTMFNPQTSLWPRVAPTERLTNGVLRGVVHDPTARRMGGVAGHAGLFTTAEDVARFARMMLGEKINPPVLKPETIREMTAVQTAGEVPARGYGWDINSPYAGPRGNHFPIGSYGHTGWTGTSLWIDPASRTFVILMSNRNHPTEQGNVVTLRRTLGTLSAEAVGLGITSQAR